MKQNFFPQFLSFILVTSLFTASGIPFAYAHNTPNSVQITDNLNFQLDTADTGSPASVTTGAGGQVTNFDIEQNYVDITLDNGSLVTITDSAPNQFISINSQSGSDYTVSPSCPTNSATLAGTGTQAVVRLQITTMNNCPAPTVTLSSSADNPTSVSPIPVTATFSGDVTGFSIDGVTVNNGTSGNFVAVGGAVYTFDVTPAANGIVSVDIGAGVATDANGKGNTAASTLQITFDDPSPGDLHLGKITVSQNVQTDNNGSIDLSDGVSTETGGNILLDNVSTPLNSITHGDLNNADLTSPQIIGDQSVLPVNNVVLKSTGDITFQNSSISDLSIVIPNDTDVFGCTNWNGTISISQDTNSGNPPAGYSIGGNVIDIGSTDCSLLLDKPATIVLHGTTGLTAYKPTGSSNWFPVSGCGGTYTSPQPPPSPLPFKECSITDGTDTKILTYHFTSFGLLDPLSPGSSGAEQQGSVQITCPNISPTPVASIIAVPDSILFNGVASPLFGNTASTFDQTAPGSSSTFPGGNVLVSPLEGINGTSTPNDHLLRVLDQTSQGVEGCGLDDDWGVTAHVSSFHTDNTTNPSTEIAALTNVGDTDYIPANSMYIVTTGQVATANIDNGSGPTMTTSPDSNGIFYDDYTNTGNPHTTEALNKATGTDFTSYPTYNTAESNTLDNSVPLLKHCADAEGENTDIYTGVAVAIEDGIHANQAIGIYTGTIEYDFLPASGITCP